MVLTTVSVLPYPGSQLDLAILAQVSRGEHAPLCTVRAEKGIHGHTPFPTSPRGCLRTGSLPYSAFVLKAHGHGFQWSPPRTQHPGAAPEPRVSGDGGRKLLTLSPTQTRAARVTLLEPAPTLLGRNHRTARSQESACVQESDPHFAAHTQDPEGLSD